MFEEFKYLSLSHQKAPVQIRELIYLNENECRKLYQLQKDYLNLQDCLVFSTCNRTEIYYHSEKDLSASFISFLGHIKGIEDIEQYMPYFDIVPDPHQAVQHLFEVAAGLHSAVLGDIQIANQVKEAYKIAVECQSTGPLLHRLLHTVFHANKRIHQETAFREGTASVSYAASQLADSLATQIIDPKALVIGAGEIGREVAINLKDSCIKNITICNRTLEKAEELSNTHGFNVLPFEDLFNKVKEFDVIIIAASGEKPLLQTQHFENAPYKLYFVIDIAVPRGASQEIEKIPLLSLYNIDDLQDEIKQAQENRKKAIPAVKKIIEEMVQEFYEWTKKLEFSPVIQKMKDALEQIRQEELKRYTKNVSEKEVERMDALSKSIIQKIIKLPVLQLKASCQRGQAETLIDVLNDLFDLEKNKVKLN
ncbi:MAG: glutamyl-tRNA reductase [Bacteroidia bacterium]|nr:glutamyl-tRNA reductase [Bacteroidia bacterium]MDW8347173.1 glutamyl-tRNA reductase [Bacteroidia bacterium]